MPDYAAYTVEDFVFDPGFQRWVRESPPAENDFWRAWLAQHPDKAADVQLARQLVRALEENRPAVSPWQVEKDVQAMMGRIEPQQQEPALPRFRVSRGAGWWAAAAAVLVVLGAGWWFNRPTGSERIPFTDNQLERGPDAGALISKENTTKSPLILPLPDGSTVTLSPHSRLSYPVAFGESSRDVTLTGEAFFSIVHKTEQPFRVYADEVVTQVLGTSFRVRAFASDPQVTVAVRTGKVAVYARKDYSRKDGKAVDRRVISLTPNQQAEFSKARAEFTKSLVDQPLIINRKVKATDFEFDETPVTEVFQRLEKAYGIDIIYDAERLSDCALSASLSEESMNEKLHIVCRGIGASYEISNGTVIIHSAGCK